MVVSMGMTLVIAVRGLDISVGAVVAIAATVAALMIGGSFSASGDVASRFPLWIALVTALGVAAACGLWNGLLVVKAGMQPIVATLILMVAGRGIAQLLTGGQIITVYYAPFFTLGNGFLLGIPVALWIAAALWGLLHLVLSRSALGLFIRAIGGNPEAARVAGVRSSAITLCVYTFCGLAAGVAGLIISSNVKSADANNAGQLLELDAILAVTLGGTALTGGRFTLAGTVIGALIIQTLTSMIYSLGVPPEVNLVVKAALVFAVMLLQSAEFRALVLRGVRASRARVPHEPPPAAARRHHAAVRRHGGIRRDPLRRVSLAAGVPQPAHRQRLPVRGGGGHDLRDPLRRHRSVGRRGHRAHHHDFRGAAQRGLESVRGHGSGAVVRRAVRRAAGFPDPALRARALHRDAGRHVPRTRLLLSHQHRVHPDQRRNLRGIAQARIPVGLDASLTVGALIALARGRGRHAHRACHRVRPHRVRHRRRRILRAAHGPAGRVRPRSASIY